MPKKKKKMSPLTAAQKKLVEDNIRLVPYAVNKQKLYVADRNEDMQDGAFTLMKAAKKFKKKRGVRFSTYAVNAIKNDLLRKKAENGLIRVPEYLNTKKYAESRHQAHATVARSPVSMDAAIDSGFHPLSPDDEETEFGYQAMRAVRWAVQKLPPIERDIVRGVVFRGETIARVGKKHGLDYRAAKDAKLQAFAKLRVSLQKHV